ncbi:hypothetical protein EV176_006042, partial [Coemansia sp. RSA 451]
TSSLFLIIRGPQSRRLRLLTTSIKPSTRQLRPTLRLLRNTQNRPWPTRKSFWISIWF